MCHLMTFNRYLHVDSKVGLNYFLACSNNGSMAQWYEKIALILRIKVVIFSIYNIGNT